MADRPNRRLAVEIILVVMVVAAVWVAGDARDSQRTKDLNAQTTVLKRVQYAACLRNNRLRAESDRRIAAHETERDVLAGFLRSAREARREGATAADRAAAQDYSDLLDRLAGVTFRPLGPVDCLAAISHPPPKLPGER